MRKALLIPAALAIAGWLASATLGAEPEGPRRGPAPGSARHGAEPPPHGSPPRGPAGRRHPFGHRHVPPIFQELTDEQVEEILAFVKEKMPRRYERLNKLRERHPALFRRMCRRLRFEIGQLRRLKKDDPEAYRAAIEKHRLRGRVADLADRARRAGSSEERQRLAAELRDALGRLFEAERKARQAQVRELEERLHQLRKQLAERAEHRDRIIDRLLERLLAGHQGPEGAESPPPAGPCPSAH